MVQLKSEDVLRALLKDLTGLQVLATEKKGNGMVNIEESARLKELISLDILDTPREERFERHTRLIAQIFNMPSVLISLVDANRQWFKSAVGCRLDQTSREETLCTYTLSLGFLEIQDTHLDLYFCDHPAVKGGLSPRFYAAAAIYGPTGQPIGTLCVIDYVPRQLSPDERSWLKAFARLVQHEINRDAEQEQDRRKLLEATLRDPLTGLPGQALLKDTLESLIGITDPEERYLVVIHVFVKNFEDLVRRHGKTVRDSLVQVLVDRLTTVNQHLLTTARVAEDRFVLIIPIEFNQSSSEVAQDVLSRLDEPAEVESRRLRTEISLGTSLYPQDGISADELIDRARRAFNHQPFHPRIHLHSFAEDERAIRRLLVEERLELALTDNKLALNYQPIFSADGSAIVCFEALVRWRDEELGVVSPVEFVPIAEKSARLSYLLTYYVLRAACKEAQTWQTRAVEQPIRVAVNIPAREFYNAGFVDTVLQVLRVVDMDPKRLTLELTEESLIQNMDQTIETMAALAKHGIELALDDFGIGYSSLSNLRRLPVNCLKIDKSFIDDLPHQLEATKLVAGIIGIAHSMGLKVVAEGVEREEQRSLLEALNCHKIQGYLLGRPVAADKIPDILNQRSESRKPFFKNIPESSKKLRT